MSAEQLKVALAGGYPITHVDRLVRDLGPLVGLTQKRLIEIDMSRLVSIGPTALALLTAVLLRISEVDLLEAGSRIVLPRSFMTRNYLYRMDLIRLLADPELPEPFVRHKAIGFRPCQCFRGKDDYPLIAADLTEALTERCDTNSIERASIRIALDELAENVVQHADSPVGGVAAAQGWPKKNTFEIGIVDLGVGIRESLSKNPAYADIADDVTAIQKALEPMVSSTPERNSGIGLFITRRLLAANGGTFLIRSGKGRVFDGPRAKAELGPVDFPGTLVALRARTDQPLDINNVYTQLNNGDDRGNSD